MSWQPWFGGAAACAKSLLIMLRSPTFLEERIQGIGQGKILEDSRSHWESPLDVTGRCADFSGFANIRNPATIYK